MLEEKDLQAIAQLIDTRLETKLSPINDQLEKMDGRMNQMQEDISNLRTTVTRVAVTQKNIVILQLKLLAEEHETLLNTLARKDRVETREDDVALLKTALKAMCGLRNRKRHNRHLGLCAKKAPLALPTLRKFRRVQGETILHEAINWN